MGHPYQQLIQEGSYPLVSNAIDGMISLSMLIFLQMCANALLST